MYFFVNKKKYKIHKKPGRAEKRRPGKKCEPVKLTMLPVQCYNLTYHRADDIQNTISH